MSSSGVNTFADPKLWFSALALAVALASFIYSWWSNKDQNKKWEALNAARIDVTNMYFVGWTEIDVQTARSTDWGYSPMLFSHVANRVHSNKMRLLDKLILWDITSDSKIEEGGSNLTKEECLGKARELKLNNGEFQIKKYMQLHFDVKNTGSTLAEDVHVNVTLMDDGTGVSKQIFKSSSRMDLHKNTVGGVNIDLFVLIEKSLPNPTSFRIHLTYKSMDDEQKRELTILYNPENDTWSYGPL